MSGRLLREPLLHFLVLGAALFGLHELVQRSAPDETARVVVTKGRIASLRASFLSKNGRPPSAEEMATLIDGAVRTEILYREAVRTGLDRDDHAVRERLADKARFVLEATIDVPPPTDVELMRFLAENADRFRPAGAPPPQLPTVRAAVEGAWIAKKREEAEAAAFEKLRLGYVVVVEKEDAP
jgi:hypothetical protein